MRVIPGKGEDFETETEVTLNLFFHAKSVIFIPVWDAMEKSITRNMLNAFKAHAEEIKGEIKPYYAPAKAVSEVSKAKDTPAPEAENAGDLAGSSTDGYAGGGDGGDAKK